MKKIVIICVLLLVILTGCRTSTAGYNYESARLQYTQKNYEKALEYINNAIKSHKKAEYYILQGDVYYKMKKFDEAIASFDSAITENKDTNALENNKQAYKKKAIVCIDIDNFELANASIEEALKIDVLDEMTKELLLYKMDTLIYIKQYKKTVECAEEFINTYTDGADKAMAYVRIGRAYAGASNFDKALEYYNMAVKEKDNTSYYYRAQTYDLMGEYEKAYNDYEEFLKYSKSEIKYSIYAKQIDSLFKLAEKTVDEEVFKKLETTINAGMVSKEEKHIKLFGKKYIALLEREGAYEEAYVYAKEYLAEYPEDEAVQNEVKFLETRILPVE